MNEPEAIRRATPQIRWIALSTVAVWIVTMTVTWEFTRGDYYRTYTSAWWVWAFVLAGGWTNVSTDNADWATDAAGTPYLLANVSGEVYEIDVEAGTARVVTTVTTGGPFDNLAFAPDGTLYLSSFVAPEVVEVGTDGTARTITIGS